MLSGGDSEQRRSRSVTEHLHCLWEPFLLGSPALRADRRARQPAFTSTSGPGSLLREGDPPGQPRPRLLCTPCWWCTLHSPSVERTPDPEYSRPGRARPQTLSDNPHQPAAGSQLAQLSSSAQSLVRSLWIPLISAKPVSSERLTLSSVFHALSHFSACCVLECAARLATASLSRGPPHPQRASTGWTQRPLCLEPRPVQGRTTS